MTTDDSGGHTSQYWSDRAEEARTMAAGMQEGFAATMMMEIARLYDRMAARAAATEAKNKRR